MRVFFALCRMMAYKILGCEVCITWLKAIAACKIGCESTSRRLADGLTKYLTWLFYDPRRYPVAEHIRIRICAVPFGMWNSSTNSVLHVSQILQRRKSGLKKNVLHFGPNYVILDSMVDKSSRGKAHGITDWDTDRQMQATTITKA